MAINKKNANKTQIGAALVEFAIVVPLLLLLVLGIIEFGYAFYHWNILNKSVQDGARYFSNPMIARYDGTSSSLNHPINVRNTSNNSGGNAPYILNTKNLVIYGSTSTGTALLPDTVPAVSVCCAEETNVCNAICNNTTTFHIRVTGSYAHNFILGNALGNFTSGTVPNSFTLTASAVLRVE